MMANPDQKFFESVPIEVEERHPLPDGRTLARTSTVVATAESLGTLIQAALDSYPEEWGERRPCVVSMKAEPDEDFTTAEHLVPEGLGYEWTKAPAGTATCDRVNATFGNYEAEWLRQGQMGYFRPFYVAEGKDDPPAYYAPNKNSRQVWFTRSEDGRRVLNVTTDVTMNLPDGSGPGVIHIKVPHNEARVVGVSLALHKMALLLLWLCRGRMVFDPIFVSLREFLNAPSETNYRPFVQVTRQGAYPGVAARFVTLTAPDPEDGPNSFVPESVHVELRVHHMLYALTLAGTSPALPGDLEWELWRDPDQKVPDTTPISFGFTSLARLL